MTRKEIYNDICRDALKQMVDKLMDCNFDTDQIDIDIKLTNHDFNESFAFSNYK